MDIKNIILVIHDLKGNGAERVVLTLADGFIQQGHSCHVVCFKNLQELPSKRQIIPFVFPMKLFRWIPRKIRGQLVAPLFDYLIQKKYGKPDLILSNLLPVDRILCHSKLKNVFMVIHSTFSKEFQFDNGDERSLQKKKEILTSIYCKKELVCVSEGVKDDLQKVFNCEIKAHRIYNPIDVKFIQEQSTKQLENHNVLPTSYLLHVGKFNNAKRQDFLIRAYALSGIKTPLVLLGQGPLREKCENLVKELNIEDKIIFYGFSKNPYPIIRDAKTLLLSSAYEGLGMVILEAIALGVSVISTDCDSGPREILPKDNLVPVDSIELFSEAIKRVDRKPEKYLCKLDIKFTKEIALRQYLLLTPST